MSATNNSVMVELDACGLACPMPLLKMKKALNGLAPGERIRVRATDVGSQRDFSVFCQQSGHQLLLSDVVDDTFVFIIEKK